MDPEMERSPGIGCIKTTGNCSSGQRTPAVCNLEFTFPLETFLRLLTRLNQRNKTQPNCSAELPSCCCATPPVGSLQLWSCLDCAAVHLSEVKLKNPETILSSGTWRSNILFLSPVCSSGCRLQSTQSALLHPALGPWVLALTWEHMSTVQRPIIVANMWWRWCGLPTVKTNPSLSWWMTNDKCQVFKQFVFMIELFVVLRNIELWL